MYYLFLPLIMSTTIFIFLYSVFLKVCSFTAFVILLVFFRCKSFKYETFGFYSVFFMILYLRFFVDIILFGSSWQLCWINMTWIKFVLFCYSYCLDFSSHFFLPLFPFYFYNSYLVIILRYSWIEKKLSLWEFLSNASLGFHCFMFLFLNNNKNILFMRNVQL